MMPNPPDRRRFLAGSAALMLGGATSPATAGPSGTTAGGPARVAVVGTGARGSDLIRALSTIESARIVAVCDDYGPHLDRGLHYAGARVEPFRDFERMLDRTRPDAVVIATPLFRHFPMAMLAVGAGCAVFCEKTMCGSVEEAKTLAGEVEARGAVFQVGLQRRSNAIYAQAEAMVRAGMLGRVVSIKAQWTRNNSWRRPLPVPRDHPDRPALERRLNWRLYRETSRGLMAELASHQLDVATRLLGVPPTRAIGTGGIDHWRDGREVFDNVSCIYEYEVAPDRPPAPPLPRDGADRPYTVRVHYASHQSNAYEGASELIMGDRGTLFLTPNKGLFYREADPGEADWGRGGEPGSADRDAAVLTAGKTLKLSNDPWAHRGKPFEIDATGDDTRDSLVSFLDCILRGDPATPCDARVGLVNAATILIGDEAMRRQSPVDFPADL
ncbi:Gfo/Idh/MocA family protein [Tautonia plasticadhaerens]|uniref:Glucose-6-phosphate 3-dehydrogenase n=1 Tax=Tautonia plasticadhaerens TaxID=2527974 RepID=A0A518GXE6_9BACT|nr:Gfo/Idh/MocA family oxidoreductase [Tautonia plasticadhaerens]QDV33274.1 Glucose-6-phosphate 3-dehydrogenase [Tautonia plasticadhaerens]